MVLLTFEVDIRKEVGCLMIKNLVISLFGVLIGCSISVAQAPTNTAGREASVPLGSEVIVHDAAGRSVLSGKLRTTELHGTPDSPITNIRLVVSNTKPFLYTYITGWATFYDTEGIRCGAGLFKVNALEPGESAEVDTPGLRLVCSPATWRIQAATLLTLAKDVTASAAPEPITDATVVPSTPGAQSQSPIPPLVLSIDGEDHPIQIGNPITIKPQNKPITLILKRAQ